MATEDAGTAVELVEDVEISLKSDMPESLLVLRRTIRDVECTYYILGTAHVSKQSCLDAAVLIQKIKPGIVLIELCSERQNLLNTESIKELPFSEVVANIRSGSATPFQAIYGWILARAGSHLEVIPGEEFRVAVQEAKSIDASVVLGDRPLSITLARVWAALSFFDKIRLCGTLLWMGITMNDAEELRAGVEELKGADALSKAMKEIAKDFPRLIQPLIVERDQYMTYILQRLSEKTTTVVAVVGAGHLEGIQAHWGAEIDIETICRMPVPVKRTRTRRSRMMMVGVAVTGAVVAFGVVRWRRR